ncbi:heme exporter protein CcmD [Sulfitobacter geojensis]|nr:heme exporter protein CcmD [Sulfitobacter geojensis]OAN95746.1 heme exporter protein CcmD [Sulfitobacter geojensis]
MPDLGKYAVEVVSAYGASLILLAVLLGMTSRRGRKARAELAQVEADANREAVKNG